MSIWVYMSMWGFGWGSPDRPLGVDARSCDVCVCVWRRTRRDAPSLHWDQLHGDESKSMRDMSGAASAPVSVGLLYSDLYIHTRSCCCDRRSCRCLRQRPHSSAGCWDLKQLRLVSLKSSEASLSTVFVHHSATEEDSWRTEGDTGHGGDREGAGAAVPDTDGVRADTEGETSPYLRKKKSWS